MDKTDDPAYWLREIAEGRQEPIETDLTSLAPDREAQVEARLAELNTERLLYKMRSEAGLTQAQVAERLGTSRPAVTYNENKPIGNMTVATLAKYANACGFRFDPSKAIERVP